MIKKRNAPQGYDNLIKEISARFDASERFSALLVSRGVTDLEKAEAFLYPNKKHLHDPFLLDGMKEATERLSEAKNNGETVVIYGDYDADGISAVTVLYKGLKDFGINAYAVIPERENGYGLTEGVLESVLDEYCPDLIVTVDCGISSHDEIENLKDLGVDVIVTDHHELPEVIPECTVINCKKKGNYPFDGLCGAGVAYKLVRALTGENADKYLDIVTVATIADSMPITDENRVIVSEGLKLIKSGRCSKAIRALIDVGGLKEITSTSLAYGIAPRVNAAGRMGDAYSALAAFMSEDNYEIKLLAAKLNDYNVKRQSECEALYEEAKKKIKDKPYSARVIMLADKNWRSGVIGIVAARLAEEYSRPTILFCEKDGVLRGSARSVDGINLYKAISTAADLTETFGGHSQAAGVSVKKENIEEFERRVNDYLVENYDSSAFYKDITVDGYADEKFDISFARELERLEPCGTGNPKPLFAVEFCEAGATPIKYGSSHVSFSVSSLDYLYFGGYDDLRLLNAPNKKTAIFEPNISEFNGKTTLKGYIRGVYTSFDDGEEAKIALFENQLRADEESANYIEINSATAQKMIDEAIKEVYGTLFVVDDLSVAAKYTGLDKFDECVLKKTTKGNLNTVCYGFIPSEIGDYERVVFLDKPLYMPIIEAKTYVNTEYRGFDFTRVTTDRNTLIGIYLKLKELHGGFASALDAMRKTSFNATREEVSFAIRVFYELKLLTYKGGRFFVESGKKCDLNQSKIYVRVKECTTKY